MSLLVFAVISSKFFFFYLVARHEQFYLLKYPSLHSLSFQFTPLIKFIGKEEESNKIYSLLQKWSFQQTKIQIWKKIIAFRSHSVSLLAFCFYIDFILMASEPHYLQSHSVQFQCLMDKIFLEMCRIKLKRAWISPIR